MTSNKRFENVKNIADKEITLNLLSNIENKNNLTQKLISTKLGIAVGLTNAYIKRCIRKGWLKVQNIPPRRYAYYLTPEGFAKKAQLTADYLSYSFEFFRSSKQTCLELFIECQKRKYKKIALVGANELTEIALLVSRNVNLEVVCIITEDDKKEFFSVKTCKPSSLSKEIDVVILTETNKPVELYKKIKKSNKKIKILIPKILGISKKIEDISV